MILDFSSYKNRGLEKNVKDKDLGNRGMDVGSALIGVGYRAEGLNAPPEISDEAFLAGRF
jgi:hypothetical protein